MQKIWQIKADDAQKVSELARAAGIDELTAKILIHRGIINATDADKFLNPEVAQEFYDPFKMSGMEDAVDRIVMALEDGEKICVYGDYDVDGMSGTALLTRALRNHGGRVITYIPERNEGYGLNVPALEKIIDRGATLLITVDCGISNAKEIAAVSDRLEVIVTDHHLPALEEILNAVAILDPHQPNCHYPEKNLCGASVAFKLCQALAQDLEDIPFSEYTNDIEIATLATIADLVPLTGENRKIVRLGLKKMSNSKCIGLNALVKVAGLENKKISASKVSFQIAPRLNSIGRLESATTGAKLLMSEDEIEATKIAKRLEEMNTERKRIEKQIFTQAEEKVQILRDEHGGNLWAITIFDRRWNPGVIGLTASKLVEKYTLPTIVISEGEKISRGSCRSIPALHMKDALDSMAELFENYGGHKQAAGFSLPTNKIPEFKRRFDEYVKTHLKDIDYPPVMEIDALIHPTQIVIKTAEEFEKLEPCGVGNPEPILACRNVHCGWAKVIGSDKTHLNFVIMSEADAGENVRAVSFGAARFASIVENSPVDIIYQIGVDEWQGNFNLKCYVSDISPSTEEKLPLTRELLTDFYLFLKNYRTKSKVFDCYDFAANFTDSAGKNFSVHTLLTVIEVFRELGVIRFSEDNKFFDMPVVGKRNLNNSRTFRLNGN